MRPVVRELVDVVLGSEEGVQGVEVAGVEGEGDEALEDFGAVRDEGGGWGGEDGLEVFGAEGLVEGGAEGEARHDEVLLLVYFLGSVGNRC